MRLQNWPQLLADTVQAWRCRPFEYGRSDCFQFAAEAVLAISGADYRDRFPRYTSELAAARILVRQGGAVGILTSVFGAPAPLLQAGRGDLLLCELERGPTVAVCVGVYCCAPGAQGLEFGRTAAAAFAWSVT